MHIVHIATELAPIAKVGGLADVLYGLSKELVKQGHQVEIILPKYDTIDYSQLKNLKVEQAELFCTEGSKQISNTVWSGTFENLRVLLLEAHHPLFYFSRDMIYGCRDDLERFTYFCRAALEYLLKSRSSPDVLHLHDWPAALVAPLYKEVYHALGLRVHGTLLTIHNLAYQGKCQAKQLLRLGLACDKPSIRAKMCDPTGHFNLLKGGIEYADLVTTVSPTYEREIKTVEHGFGLDEVLIKHQRKVKGILNGIDYDYWNPEKDPLLVKRYSTSQITSGNLAQVLEGRAANRQHLRTHFNLRDGNLPLVACITRLVPQKGPELLLYALKKTLKSGGAFVLLGSDHGTAIEEEFLAWHGKEQKIGITIDRDEALAHLIFASADILLIPSRYEPCGLTQMIALRYGAVPLVRRTGGLADSVFDIDTSERLESERNGFTFDYFDAGGIDWALDRALHMWQHDRAKWQQIMLNGMRSDYSWTKPAARYLELYNTLISRKEKAA